MCSEANFTPDPDGEDAVVGTLLTVGGGGNLLSTVRNIIRCIAKSRGSDTSRDRLSVDHDRFRSIPCARASRVPAVDGVSVRAKAQRSKVDGHGARAFSGPPVGAGAGDGLAAGIAAGRIVEFDDLGLVPVAGPVGAPDIGADSKVHHALRIGASLDLQVLGQSSPGFSAHYNGWADQGRGQAVDGCGAGIHNPCLRLCRRRQGKGGTQQDDSERLKAGGGGGGMFMINPHNSSIACSIPPLPSAGKGDFPVRPDPGKARGGTQVPPVRGPDVPPLPAPLFPRITDQTHPNLAWIPVILFHDPDHPPGSVAGPYPNRKNIEGKRVAPLKSTMIREVRLLRSLVDRPSHPLLIEVIRYNGQFSRPSWRSSASLFPPGSICHHYDLQNPACVPD